MVAAIERLPPQNMDAEQSVLGGMLLSKDAIADCVEQLKGTDFYRPAHELIYDAVLDLYGRGEPADQRTLLEAQEKGLKEPVHGGTTYFRASAMSRALVSIMSEYVSAPEPG